MFFSDPRAEQRNTARIAKRRNGKVPCFAEFRRRSKFCERHHSEISTSYEIRQTKYLQHVQINKQYIGCHTYSVQVQTRNNKRPAFLCKTIKQQKISKLERATGVANFSAYKISTALLRSCEPKRRNDANSTSLHQRVNG